MIIWKKNLIECCKCHKKYSFDDNLFYYLKKYILICPNCNLSHEIDIKLLEEKYDRLKKINKLNLTAIDIGGAATDRASLRTNNFTYVAKDNPANETGTITSIEIWAVNDLVNCEVATFFVVSGDNLSTRDTETIGAVTSGSKQTFGVSLDVEAGDYIGMYYGSGNVETDFSGYAGLWQANADYIPCTNAAFTVAAGDAISLYGTGATAGAEDNAIFFGTNF